MITHATSNCGDGFDVDSHFFGISNSEFCSDTLQDILSMDYEEFSELEDQVTFYSDLKRAAQEDHDREQSKQDAAGRMGQRG